MFHKVVFDRGRQ